ncbi:MAG: hypothetical protein ACX93O_11600 [Flagellimonas sp.]
MNQNLLWPVILVALVLWAVFIWKEWSQRGKRMFWVKIVAGFLALVSLAMIVLKPSIWEKSTKGKGIVLTAGYRTAQLDSLKSIYKRIQTEEYTKGTPLSIVEEADSLFLLGRGLPSFDLWQLEDKSLAFLGGEQVEDWTEITYDRTVTFGDAFTVKAKHFKPRAGYWTILADNGGNPLDSVPFEAVDEQLIQLNAKPKASGQFIYRLLEKNDEGEIISNEPLPVQVVDGKPLKILMVNTFPTFETKYLKNFLTDKGHQVMARTQLTKGKYKFEYFNGASNPIYGFTQENLKEYDLLVIDTDSYIALGRSSKEAMEEAVKINGLGVFVQPNENLFRLAERQSPFQFDRDFITEITLGVPAQSVQKYPLEFKNDVRTQRISVDSANVAAYVPMEKGKIGTTLLQNTYQLFLDGKEELYAGIWTQILNNIAREQEALAKWKALTQTPRLDEPFQFEVRTSMNGIRVTTDKEANIPLLQDGLVQSKWKGVVYPRKKGWNELKVSKDSIAHYSYYVFDGNQHKTISQSETLKANLRQFGSENTFGASVSASKKAKKPISPFWFYGLLLLCFGWLWLAPKLTGH